ncbi:MAG: hypothetical protein ILP12_07415 [Lachnospiraceae bacterium]|nr:hypothetical protein [Lachnospiraceae bacterium]
MRDHHRNNLGSLRKLLYTVLAAIWLLSLVSCAPDPAESGPDDSWCTVILTEGSHFTCAEPVLRVPRGGDAVFFVTAEEGWEITGVSYREATVSRDTGSVTLHNILFPVRAEVKVQRIPETVPATESPTAPVRPTEPGTTPVPEDPVIGPLYAGVRYHAAGGTADDGEETRLIRTYVPWFPRVNTSNGNWLSREGYTLTGWNTQEDGQGLSIGLGSRATVQRSGIVELYAEWAAWDPASEYEYVLLDRAVFEAFCASDEKKLPAAAEDGDRVAVITAWHGTGAAAVVPAVLGGCPVAGIGFDAFASEKLTRLILPETIRFIGRHAFAACPALEEVTLSDSIVRLDLEPFPAAVRTLHLNASLPPFYGSEENAQFCNKMEILINNTDDRPLMVVFGGCSAWYGVSAQMIGSALFEQYNVINMAVIGGVTARFQLDLILPYLKAGDSLIHVPEFLSEFQLMANNFADNRFFITMEGNYDLIAELDLTRYPFVFRSLRDYLLAKQKLLASEEELDTSYVIRREGTAANGDMELLREGGYDNHGEPYSFVRPETFLNLEGPAGMKEYYGKLAEKGVSVYWACAPVNTDGLTERELGYGRQMQELILKTFEEQGLSVTCLLTLDEALMGKAYFYDTNYHPSTEGSWIYTERLADKLRQSLAAQQALKE